jgi:hypothetical protein
MNQKNKNKNVTLLFYKNKYEKGVYYEEENLLYIDKENSSFLDELRIWTNMRCKRITPVQREKLKTLTVVKENPYKTFCYKFFFHYKMIPPCFSLGERVLHFDDFEVHLKNLNEWIERIHFIHDSLSDDPVKQIILIQKAEDLISWSLKFQNIKPYKDEFRRIINYLRSEFEIKKLQRFQSAKLVSKDIQNFDFTEKEASIIYLEFRKTILDDNVEEEMFVSALTTDWDKLNVKIKIACETAEFAILIDEFKQQTGLNKVFNNKNIDKSKLFISKSGRLITYSNLRKSLSNSKINSGFYQEKKDKMIVHINGILSQMS